MRTMVASRSAVARHPATLVALVAVSTWVAIVITPSGTTLAMWWPASGFAAAALFLAPARRWPAISAALVGAGVVAQVAAGRPLGLGTAFTVIVLAESLVVAWVLRRHSSEPRLVSLDDLKWLGLAIAAGLVALLPGLAVLWATMLDGVAYDVLARQVVLSHTVALLGLLPLYLHRSPTQGAPRVEAVLQFLALAGVLFYVFGPAMFFSLPFLILPVTLWGAVRLTTTQMVWQNLAVALTAVALTSQTYGPFRPEAGTAYTTWAEAITALQAFLMSSAAVVLTVTIVNERNRSALRSVSESERLFRRNFEGSMIGMALLRLVDGRLVVTEVNGPAAELLGRDPRAIPFLPLQDLLATDDDLDAIAADMVRGAQGGYRREVGVAGRPHVRMAFSLALLEDAGADQRFTAQMLDFTAEREAGRRLSAERSTNRAILDTTEAIIVVVSLDGTVRMLNAAAERLSGYDAAEIIGLPVWERLFPDEDRDEVRRPFEHGAIAQLPLEYEARLLTRAGELRRVELVNSFLTDDAGDPTAVVMTGIDVTSQHTTTRMMSHLLNAASATAFIGTDLSGVINVWNAGAHEMLGYTADEALGHPILDLVFDSRQVAGRADEADESEGFAALAAQTTTSSEARDWLWLRRDGSKMTVSQALDMVLDASGHPIGYLFAGRDVTAKQRSQELLLAALDKERQAVERLRSLDDAKNDFVTTVSHELRTPITSIVGYIEMMEDGDTGEIPPAQMQLFDVVRRNAFRLRALADDLLTLAGFETGTQRVEQRALDLVEVVRAVEASLRPDLASRRLDVVFDLPAEPVIVSGDDQHLERAITNLITNAIKFTDDGGTIRCSLTTLGNSAHLQVTDSGMGIPADEIDHVFDRFFRTTNAQERAVQGTGLGLAIVSSIVEKHGGQVSVNSVECDGTTFDVRLPLDLGA